MLFNEFLKEHKKAEAQQTTIAKLKSTLAHHGFLIQEGLFARLFAALHTIVDAR